jgi:hypothetical protein
MFVGDLGYVGGVIAVVCEDGMGRAERQEC